MLEAKENKTRKRLKVQTQARFYKTKNMRGFQRITSFPCKTKADQSRLLTV